MHPCTPHRTPTSELKTFSCTTADFTYSGTAAKPPTVGLAWMADALFGLDWTDVDSTPAAFAAADLQVLEAGSTSAQIKSLLEDTDDTSYTWTVDLSVLLLFEEA